jgi:hypothetical protein
VLDRAVERHNLALFNLAGKARELAATMRLAAETIADVDSSLASAVLSQAEPESPDNSAVAGCIGVALGLLDDWLSGHHRQAPARLCEHARPPRGHWTDERAAADILHLAGKGRPFRSLNALMTRQGGKHMPYGSALALAAAITAWSRQASTPVAAVARTAIR